MADGMIEVQLCAPESPTLSLTVPEVVCPGADGVFTVRPGHTLLLTTLVPGVVIVHDSAGKEQSYAVGGGFAEVAEGDRVTILADVFEEGPTIDVPRAKAAQQRAEARLRKPAEDTDLSRAELALARSLARIEASERKYF